MCLAATCLWRDIKAASPVPCNIFLLSMRLSSSFGEPLSAHLRACEHGCTETRWAVLPLSSISRHITLHPAELSVYLSFHVTVGPYG